MKLSDKAGYLVGGIDRMPDAGRAWRTLIGDWLRQRGCRVFDPTNKRDWAGFDETPETIAARKAAKQRGDFDLVAAEMRQVQAVDLWAVRTSDFIVAYITPESHLCGSYFELALAIELSKPIFIHVAGGKTHTPDWLLGCVPHQQIFDDWASLQNYLEN